LSDYYEITSYLADRVTISPWVSSHIFEGQLLVFSERSQTIFELNPSAGFIWLCCEKRMILADIIKEMSEAFGISPMRAESDVKSVISQWMSLELLEKELGEALVPVVIQQTMPSEDYPTVGQWYGPDIVAYKNFFLNLAGLDFLMRFSHREIEQLVTPVFAHLESSHADQPTIFDVVQIDNQVLIVIDGFIVDVFSIQTEICPRLSYHLIDLVYRKIDFLIAIHAAALSLGNSCVVFPGNSGVGKTTLSAALIKTGFKYFTDDTAILDRRTRRIVEVPVSLRIKEGSWETVEKMFHKSFAVTVHGSSDGRKIRYLAPPKRNLTRGKVAANLVKALVFPRYSPEFKTSIRLISRLDAIHRLQECGYDVGACLNKAKVVELLDWIKNVDCYEMNIGSLSEATSIVRRLLV
jgi:Coenzyme PQQ synthesis protein D (PqqD)